MRDYMPQATPMQPAIEATRLEAWSLFLRAHSDVIRVLDRELEEKRGLALTAFDVLVHLGQREDPWRMHELADSLLLSRSGATRLVEKLERDGLVTRAIDEGDRRGIQVSLTPHGIKTIRRALPVHHRGIRDHFTQHLTDTEAAHLCSALTKIIAANTPVDHRAIGGTPAPAASSRVAATGSSRLEVS